MDELKNVLSMIRPGVEFVIRNKLTGDKRIEVRAVVDGDQYVCLHLHPRQGKRYQVISLDELAEMWHSGRLVPPTD